MFRRHSDIPLGGDPSSRFLPWIIGFMVWLAALALTGAGILGDQAARWTAGMSGTLTVQVMPDPEGPAATAVRLSAVMELLAARPGIAGARVLEGGEVLALLEPWLGSGGDLAGLPLPRVIDVTLDRAARPDIAALAAVLAAAAPGTVVDDHRRWLGDLIGLLRSIETVVLLVVLLTALVAGLTVVFAARTGLAVHAHVIELLHLAGARDAYVSRQFGLHAMRLGLLGGLLGLALAGLTFALVAWSVGEIDPSVLPVLSPGPLQWLLLLLLPGLAAGIAMLTARMTVMRALARMP